MKECFGRVLSTLGRRRNVLWCGKGSLFNGCIRGCAPVWWRLAILGEPKKGWTQVRGKIDRCDVDRFGEFNFVSLGQMMEYRGILSVDGHANEWDRLFWKLESSSVVLLVESSRYYQWYYEHMQPWVHYVPVQNDLSDLQGSVEFVLDPGNDRILKAMSTAATELTLSLTYRNEMKRTSQRIVAVVRRQRQRRP